MKKLCLLLCFCLICLIILMISCASRHVPIEVTAQDEIIGKDGASMVLIPAGEFEMGSSEGESDEKPAHTVYLDAFYIDKYEVTNAQYEKFVRATGHNQPDGNKMVKGQWQSGFKPWTDHNFNGNTQPVVCVNWEDAKAYADWADKRLPTEAEWEKAARGKLVGKKYVWGDEWPPPKGAGNFDDENVIDNDVINGYIDGYAYTAPVGQFNPNGYGLYDMAGNVWEWCADWYDSSYYASSPKSNPNGPSFGEYHILRGGSWDYEVGRYLRVTLRACSPSVATYNLGFRCAIDAKL
jgi:formylglycine-generating enzyme required for sulfatase activity